MNEAALGTLVTARAGRDRGASFLIVGVCDEAHVFIADGRTRRLQRPKKKKLMHLHAEPQRAAEIGSRLAAGETVSDADVRNAIAALTRTQAN